MSIADRIRDFVLDPPPGHLFEISHAGVAWWVEGRRGFAPLPAETLTIQPQSDNVADLDTLVRTIQRIAPDAAGQRRRPCVVLLPDYAGRITVLDFDSFPGKAGEQLALVRFRIKKSLPFDADAAAVTYLAQASSGNRREVVISAVALEILSRYEAAFRAAGYHPGWVSLSSLAALNLIDPAPGLTFTARLSGRVLTITASTDGRLRLTRCIELTEVSAEEISGVLVPTVAYAEDEFTLPAGPVFTAGFPETLRSAFPDFLAVEPMVSPLGPVDGENAGLLGYLRGQLEARRAA